jgi:hypothetical protein
MALAFLGDRLAALRPVRTFLSASRRWEQAGWHYSASLRKHETGGTGQFAGYLAYRYAGYASRVKYRWRRLWGLT